MRPVIEALIAGPPEVEAKQGYVAWLTEGMKLTSVTLHGGIALIDLTREIRADYNPGDLEMLGFEADLVRTGSASDRFLDDGSCPSTLRCRIDLRAAAGS